MTLYYSRFKTIGFAAIVFAAFLCFCPTECVYIKVLLKELNLTELNELSFSSGNGLIIDVKKPSEKKQTYYFKSTAHFSIKQNKLFLNNQFFKTVNIRIRPIDGHLQYNHGDYYGTFYIICEQEHVQLINKLDLEDYVHSVLHTESWPGWPLEVNKVMAIAIRTYALRKILDARKLHRPYHIKNSNIHQTYYGFRYSNDIHRQAVDETSGIFLAYNGQPIAAMYDSCCGGISPAKVDSKAVGIDFKEAPYLARKRVCTFCKDCKTYSWHFEISSKEFERKLAAEFPDIKKIISISIHKKDNAGLVQSVIIHTAKKDYILSNKKLYSLFKQIKSSVYTVTKKRNNFIFSGNGLGHHLGLCQWGAYKMAELGWPYKRILRFFYEDISFMKLCSTQQQEDTLTTDESEEAVNKKHPIDTSLISEKLLL
jgi:stage II sporulation protein D